MKQTWTQEQMEAITTRGCNLLVSAAAGAGKTAVLVERIIHSLLDPVNPLDINSLLVVTFTESASAEMRERIGVALEEKLAERPELARQLVLLGGASISTLHSFCLEVIRRYFYLIDQDPVFRVADETEASLLQQEVLEELLEEAFISQEEDHSFKELADYYGGRHGDEGLSRLILRVYKYTRSDPWPDRWLAEAAAAFATVTGRSPEQALDRWLEPLRFQLGLELSASRHLLAKALTISGMPGGPAGYQETLSKEMEWCDRLLAQLHGPWETLRKAWLSVSFPSLPRSNAGDNGLRKCAKELREQAKDRIRAAQRRYFARGIDDYAGEVARLAPLVNAIVGLVRNFSNRYTAAKKARGLLDFNDLEHCCLKILQDTDAAPGRLSPSVAALELRKRFAEVLVDEYQDINPVQDTILELVSRQGEEKPNLFMVGDVKQSIYRFRLGDPGLFQARYHSYPEHDGERERKLILSYNFRCRPGVVDAVNYLFSRIMLRETAEVEYDRAAELVCGLQYPTGFSDEGEAAELHLLEKGQVDEDVEAQDGILADTGALEREGLIIVHRIRALVEGTEDSCPFMVYDKEEGRVRPASYRDIAILLRATTGRAEKLVELLNRHGIPAYAELSCGYFSAMEVETMLSLLKIIDNPCQDIPLAAVLRSPLVGFCAEELATIRAAIGDGDFYTAVIAAAQANLSGISERLSTFLQSLERWRNLSRRESLAVLISTIYRESRLPEYAGGLPDGRQRLANLHALLDRARQFDGSSHRGLFSFLQFIEQLKRSGRDLGMARVLGEKEDVVRVMSIHKAKGLEFSIVFVCSLGKAFNFQDQREDVLIHRNLGLGPLVVDTVKRLRYPSLPYLALKLIGEAENRAEEMRILYVALTRAREKLVLVGSLYNAREKWEKWQGAGSSAGGRLPAYETSEARSYLDWLGPVIAGCSNTHLFGVKLWDEAQLNKLCKDLADSSPRRLQENWACSVDSRRIREIIRYRYPFTGISGLPAKLSVSEAKALLYKHQNTFVGEAAPMFTVEHWSRPAFAAEKAPASKELGALYHLVLQHLDINGKLDDSGISSQIGELCQKNVLPPETSSLINPNLLAAFFRSEPGRIVLDHRDRVKREWPFIFTLPAIELYPGFPGIKDEKVVIQGIVDVLVETPAGYVIIDYKSGGKRWRESEEQMALYRGQLALYARAVTGILGRPVIAAFLYFLAGGRSVKIL